MNKTLILIAALFFAIWCLFSKCVENNALPSKLLKTNA